MIFKISLISFHGSQILLNMVVFVGIDFFFKFNYSDRPFTLI